MIEIIKLTTVLTTISLIAATAIAVTDSKTKDRIAQKQESALKNALEQILPAESTIEEIKGSGNGLPEQYWIARSQNGSDSIYVFQITSRGYTANIKYIVSVSTDGTIRGLTILDQSETPGLGSRVQEVVTKQYIWNGLFGKKDSGLHWFTEQFKGISILKQIGLDRSSGE